MIVIIAIIAVVVIGVGVKLHQGNSVSTGGSSAAIEQEGSLSSDQIELNTDDKQDSQTTGADSTDVEDGTKTEGDIDTKDDVQSESRDDKDTSSDSNSQDSSADAENSGTTTPDNSATTAPEPEEETLTCTVTIKCDTILNNMANLTPGKEGLVPSSGYILGKTTIEFEEGDTAFDVTKEACANAGIQIEYSFTPAYNSYYVEGINNLYEFDCGPDSGWMYKVNGWFPNYGSSSYEVQDGDKIVWCYTCVGLGADVGGSNY